MRSLGMPLCHMYNLRLGRIGISAPRDLPRVVQAGLCHVRVSLSRQRGSERPVPSGTCVREEAREEGRG